MYAPPAFSQTDLSQLHGAIKAYSFAALISQSSGHLSASHLPLLLDRTQGPYGTLVGHMARANPQWQEAAAQNVLCVFSGPHAYISPTWYADQHVVPTWNYVAIHAEGPLQIIESALETEDILRLSVQTYEQYLPIPWELKESADFVAKLVAQVVAFRIPIGRLEGKWKLNQNHPPERRRRTISALRQQPGDNARQIADLMTQMLPPLPDA